MKTKLGIIFGLISIVLAACDGPTSIAVLPTPPPGPIQTWIDAPLPHSTLPLLPYKLVFHGTSHVGVTEFEIKINGITEGVVSPVSSGSGGSQYRTLFHGEYNWNPPAPGIYLIQVRAKGAGVFSSPDQVQVTISGDDFALISSPTPTIAVEEVNQCTYTALISHFCRRGPGLEFEAVDNFIPGQFAPVTGQSTDGFFWYVIGPNYGELCTVPSEEGFGELSGDCETLPRFTPIPLPTPTGTPEPTPCPAGVHCP
jgi:hypothetical protein